MENEKKVRPIELDFVMVIFFIRGIYWAYTFSEYFEPPWEFGDVVVLLFILVFSGFYIIPAIGIYRGRRYGYYSALFMLCIEIPLLLLLFPIYTIGIILAGLILVLLFYLILQNRSTLKNLTELIDMLFWVWFSASLCFY